MSRARIRMLFLVSAATVGVLVVVMPAGADQKVPYSDPNAVGTIGLCDQHGHQIISGSIDDQPFAWIAVSSAAAPSTYSGKNAAATLFAFQPRDQVPAGEWSGRELTASSVFSNPRHPMAASTSADEPLLTFVQAFPPRVQGLIELRLYLSAPNAPALTNQYPAMNLRVSGNRWTVVDPVKAACGSGHAVSIETTNLPPSAFGSQAAVVPHGKSAPGGSANSGAGSGGSTAAGAAGTASTSTAAERDGGSTGTPLWVFVVIPVVIVGTAGEWWRRRRVRVGGQQMSSG